MRLRVFEIIFAVLGLSCGSRMALELTPYTETFSTSGLVPRAIAPLSLGDVTLLRPTFRWELPAEFDGVVVELCRDRACTQLIETIRTRARSARPSLPLPPRSVVFWRLRGMSGSSQSPTASAPWLFHVPSRDNSGGIDTSYGAHFDVNGDGFDDVVVSGGSVRVFHGSASGIPMDHNRLLPHGHGVFFDSFVASAGDVNGDGFGDLMVSDSRIDPASRERLSAVSLYHGGITGIPSTPSRGIESVSPNDSFGYSMASAGDVNGDGFGDIVVGASGAAVGDRTSVGTASIFHGSINGLRPNPTRVLEGSAAGDAFGISVAGAGDLNGDGFADLVVGAYSASPGGRRGTGTASVYHGGVNGITMAPTQILEGVTRRGFGHVVAGAGDVNGDGFSDVVVVDISPPAADQIRQEGRANIYHGSAGGIQVSPSSVIVGHCPNGYDRVTVTSAGDLNGDGYGDVIAEGYRLDRDDTGLVDVYHGASGGLSAVPARVLEGQGNYDLFGFSLAGAGDVNRDGFSDFIVGSMSASPGGRERAGTASVYHGSGEGSAMTPARILEGANAGDRFGGSVASAHERFSAQRSRLWASIGNPRAERRN